MLKDVALEEGLLSIDGLYACDGPFASTNVLLGCDLLLLGVAALLLSLGADLVVEAHHAVGG